MISKNLPKIMICGFDYSLGKSHNPQRSFVEYSVRQPSFSKRAEKIKRKNDALANLKMLEYLNIEWDSLNMSFGKKF
jgi:exopolysaccharide biosynthesis protein